MSTFSSEWRSTFRHERPELVVRTPGTAGTVVHAPDRPVETATRGADPASGVDWSKRTTAEALAAGVRTTVRCVDGWHVPGG